MGLFNALFGSKVSLAALQRAVEQKRFADARYLAAELKTGSLSAEERDKVASLDAAAGDGIAGLNLIEARAKQGSGDQAGAQQHFDLALEHACSAALREEIELSLRGARAEVVAADTRSSASLQRETKVTAAPGTVDAAIQLELILTSYPEPLRQRYAQKSPSFIEAFLLAHDGQDARALPLFEQLEAAEQDDLYWFELGALLARGGRLDDARTALETSLQHNPQLSLALEALVEVLLALQLPAEALALVTGRLEQGDDVPLGHALAATIHARRQHWPEAVQQVEQALAAGYDNSAFIPLAAAVFEHAGRLDDAEAVLKKLSRGGCKGGPNLLLAEFYLRHGQNLEKAFSAFNTAVRQEPDNPRWKLRLAQVCLLRQWHADAVALLNQIVDDPALSPELQRQAVDLLAGQRGGRGDA